MNSSEEFIGKAFKNAHQYDTTPDFEGVAGRCILQLRYLKKSWKKKTVQFQTCQILSSKSNSFHLFSVPDHDFSNSLPYLKPYKRKLRSLSLSNNSASCAPKTGITLAAHLLHGSSAYPFSLYQNKNQPSKPTVDSISSKLHGKYNVIKSYIL